MGKHWIKEHIAKINGKIVHIKGHWARNPRLSAHDRAVDRKNVRKAERARKR